MLRIGRDYFLMVLGCALIAVGIDMFMVPNGVVTSGVAGLAMLAHFVWKVPVGVANLVLNVPLFALGFRVAGLRFIIRSLFATVLMSVFIDAFAPWVSPLKGDPLIYTIFGGILDGVGVGLVLRAQSSTGGTDIIAMMLNKYRSISFGSIFLVANTLILVMSIPVVGLVPVLYALIMNYISSRSVDVVLEGPGLARAAFIVSEQFDEIRKAILRELGRGVTLFEGTGGFTGEPRKVLYVVVPRSQLMALRQIVKLKDAKAFVVISDAHDVLGEGFKPIPS